MPRVAEAAGPLRPIRFRRCLFAIGCAALLAAPARAAAPAHAASETPAAEKLGTASLPGSPEALARLAGLTRAPERSRLMPEIVRALYGEQSASLVRLEETRVYIETLENARLAWQTAGAGAGLALPAPGATPAGPVVDALGAIGWRLRREGGKWRLSEGPAFRLRQRTLQLAGVDVAALALRLEAGEAVPWPVGTFAVPLPLDPAAWRALLGSTLRDDAAIAPAILRDRQAALLYYGLIHAGPGTLSLAASSSDVLALLGRRASAFAAFGSSFALSEGRVVPPGGPSRAAVWELVVQQPVANPSRFLAKLLEHDDGRLAWFYETLARLEPGALAFAMGGADASLDTQVAALTALYRVFEPIARDLGQPAERDPLVRPALDPSLLLLQLRALPTGRLAPPGSASFWEAVFETEETDETVRLEARGNVDAAYLVSKVFAPVRQHRYDRFDAVLFAQRVFGAAADAELPDAAVALRGFGRYRSLLVTLERLGIRDAGTYARAVRHAARIGKVRHVHGAPALHSQFQGALALVERLRIVRRLTETEAHRLVESLVALQLDSDDSYRGGIAHWIETTLLTSLGVTPPLADDQAILAALAGVASSTTPAGEPRAPEATWLDWSYRLDLGAAALEQLSKIREKQGGNSLAAVLALAAAARSLQDRSLTLPRLQELLGSLEATGQSLQSMPVADRPEGRPWSVRAAITWALAELRLLKRADQLPRAAAVGAGLTAASDIALGDVLRALAYAPHLGDPSGPLLLGGDVSHRHDFGVTIKDADTRLHAAWSLPEAPTGYGLTWQVWGALLGLDIGLANLRIPQVTVGGPDAARAFSEQGRKAMLQGLALFNAYDVTDTGMRQVAERIRRGRQAAAALASAADRGAQLAGRAGLPAHRIRILDWSLDHERDALDAFFSMPELLRLGGTGPDDDAWAAQWGASQVGWNGSLLLGWAPAARALSHAGRLEAPHLAAGFPDLNLRVAELIADLDLPARIAGPLARVVVADFLDQVAAGREDDTIAWAAYAATYARGKLESAVSALTSEGILRSSVEP